MSAATAPNHVNCMKCVHHFITYDPHFPYGCYAMHFKSRRLPHYEVVGASSEPCLSFAPKRDTSICNRL